MDWPEIGDERNLHLHPAHGCSRDANAIVLAGQDWSGGRPALRHPARRRATGLNIEAAISYDRMLAVGGMFTDITTHPW
jgi:hypothetical protein